MKKFEFIIVLALAIFLSKSVLADKCQTTCNNSGIGCVEACYDNKGNLTSRILYESSTGFGDEQPSTLALSENDGKFYIGGTEYQVKAEETYENGKITSAVSYDKNGGSLTYNYTYDSAGNVSTNMSGDSRYAYEYDAKGNKTKEVSPTGSTTTYEYDADGNKTKEVSPTGSTTTYEYDADGNMTKKTDGYYAYEYEYDANNRISKRVDWFHDEYEYEYDENGNMTKRPNCTGCGSYYTYEYDDYGYKTKEIGPYGVIITFDNVYDDGKLISQTDSGGKKYEYDEQGRLIKGWEGDFYYEYSYEGNITKKTGYGTTYEYDEFGNLVKNVSANGNTVEYNHEYEYDSEGRAVKARVQNPYGSYYIYEYEYDDNGHVVSREIMQSEYEYDTNGNLIRRCNVSNGTCQTYDVVYDEEGRLIKGTDSYGHYYTYEYDDEGNLAKMTASGQIFEYDENGRLISDKFPWERNGRTYEYDDEQGRLVKEGHSDGYYTYEYDDYGNLIAKNAVFDFDGLHYGGYYSDLGYYTGLGGDWYFNGEGYYNSDNDVFENSTGNILRYSIDGALARINQVDPDYNCDGSGKCAFFIWFK